MKVYLVGGAVRDKLLGLPVKEKDWVVVGASSEDMLKQGYLQVGKDFPVFIHPQTGEEYALARTERKMGPGYRGFTFDASSHVTLEEDLKRRDLTINAMAETSEGIIVDPYHGAKDLQQKMLRHVSEAFVEDPVRILRVARFAARYEGFTVAPETIKLMQQMVQSGEVNALVPERVWKEMERALTEKHPEIFFDVLAECYALPILFPEINMQGEGIKQLQKITIQDSLACFAVLLHDLSEMQVQAICKRYRVPSEYRWMAAFVAKNLSEYQQVNPLLAENILSFLERGDAFRREERFKKFLHICECCLKESNTTLWLQYLQAAKSVDVKAFVSQYQGKDIAEMLRNARLVAIQKVCASRVD